MKTVVEALWALVIFGASLASLWALTELDAGTYITGGLILGLFALLWATWHTHWGG